MEQTKHVYLLAGHNLTDPGAPAAKYGMTEAQLTRNLRDCIFLKIKGDTRRKSATILMDSDEDTLREVLAKIPSTPSDIILDIHFNSAATNKATGTEAFIQPNRSGDEYARAGIIAAAICDAVSATLGIKNRGVKNPTQSNRGKLGLMQEKGAVVLLEVCFINNPEELDKYLANEDAVAEAIAEVILQNV